MSEEKRQDSPKSAATRRRRRRRKPSSAVQTAEGDSAVSQAAKASKSSPSQGKAGRVAPSKSKAAKPAPEAKEIEVRGILEINKDHSGFLRDPKRNLEPKPDDPKLPTQLVRRFHLKRGCEIVAKARTGGGPPQVGFIQSVDGMELHEHKRRPDFRKLTVIDPDFHYEMGTYPQEGQLSMRIMDLLAPLGRGQRALLVAPPRSGKTMLMQQMARAIESEFPEVRLIVLLIDERPEEATYWKREVQNGEVFVSTLDDTPENHVRLAEMAQYRCERLVEAGKDVVLLLDSITRLARAHNHVIGGKGKIMSGGIDSRTMAKPKNFFGAARNTERAGSLTMVGTTLVETGSRMDQVIFEEFKGTGNMEIVLDRRLADRRIFPAISVERSGTRKEEKLRSRSAMQKVNILGRVLSRMRPLEAMELLVGRLDKFPTNRDFLNAFSNDDVD